jgi:Metallopeptidase family M24
MAAKNGSSTGSVDEAARAVLESKGLGKYFTHRLGHGIGMQMHESPYLRGGSKDIILTGHTFSDEPGVYIEGEVRINPFLHVFIFHPDLCSSVYDWKTRSTSMRMATVYT